MTDPLGKVAVIVIAALASALCAKAAGAQEADGEVVSAEGDTTLHFDPTSGALTRVRLEM